MGAEFDLRSAISRAGLGKRGLMIIEKNRLLVAWSGQAQVLQSFLWYRAEFTRSAEATCSMRSVIQEK